MSYSVAPLGDQDLSAFDCANTELNEWLVQHARNATGQGTRTYVLVSDETSEVVGYFAIAPHLIGREEAPKKIGRGAPRQIPAILLAKLAVDRSVQGQGLGSDLLVAALDRIVEVARRAGGKLIVVDAVDETAAAFYRHHDFEPAPGHPRRLVMKLSSAATALGVPWP